MSIIASLPIRHLPDLIRRMKPTLAPELLVYARLAEGEAMPPGLLPLALVREAEGTTIILPQAEAERAGLKTAYPCRRIVLGAHSDLEAVGFLATITAWLGGHGIACNVLSAWHHDHLLVPHQRAFEALDLLKELQAEAVG